LADHYEKKRKEEAGHDRWAAQDLTNVRESFAVAAPTEVFPAIGRLIDFQHSTIDRSPTSYLAYTLVAEYFIVLMGERWVQTLDSQCGIPPTMATVITRHVQLDRGHVAAGMAEIDALVRAPEQFVEMRQVLREALEILEQFGCELRTLASVQAAAN
jgi:hypothetical protein